MEFGSTARGVCPGSARVAVPGPVSGSSLCAVSGGSIPSFTVERFFAFADGSWKVGGLLGICARIFLYSPVWVSRRGQCGNLCLRCRSRSIVIGYRAPRWLSTSIRVATDGPCIRLPVGSRSDLISAQARGPAEFKHIIKRRKRNQLGFPQ